MKKLIALSLFAIVNGNEDGWKPEWLIITLY